MTIHYSGNGRPSDALIELMAPDGYYRYLEIPKPSSSHSSTTTTTTKAKDGGGGDDDDPTATQEELNPLREAVPLIDEDLVKKRYRTLSRRHHPDRPNGDADTFRLLNRAQRVLLNPNLRRQYDILGVDLDEDEEEDDHDVDVDNDVVVVVPPDSDGGGGDASTGKKGNGGSSSSSSGEHRRKEQRSSTSSAQGIIGEIAGMVLASLMQLGVRTGTF